MKRQKLLKAIKEKGAVMIRQGGAHEVWESKNGYRFAVPRHAEIKEGTAKIIIKQADK
jgi:predicted RNA binding protein YcfA (HicA-like mRNA interferase family)